MKTKILKFGFEIEHETVAPICDYLQNYGVTKNDGSLDLCDDHDNNEFDAWEFASNPYTYNLEGLRQARKIFQYLQKQKDNKGWHSNITCGFHVHVSFKPYKPAELMSIQFHDYFIAQAVKNFPEECKTRAGNRFCVFDEVEEDIIKTHDRYKAINYSMEHHKTLEFRLFPSSGPDKMFEYLKFILKTCDKFIKKGVSAKIDGEWGNNDVIVSHDRSINNNKNVIISEYIDNELLILKV